MLDEIEVQRKTHRKYLFQVLFVIFFISANLGCYLLEKSRAQSVSLDSLYHRQVIPWGVEKTHSPQFWSQGYTGKGVKIAILDTGVNPSHPDLGNIHEGFNALSPNQASLDDNGHGTMVTGIINAIHNNIGITGIAPGADIYPIKVLDKFGEGNIDAIVKGIDWCIEHHIQLINMSFAIPNDDAALREAIQRANDAGIIIIASGSNSSGGIVGFPASYDEVISVTSVDKHDVIGAKSPRGKVDYSAPGVDIISTMANGGYKMMSGTSFAAPHLTGVTALLLEKYKGITKDEVIMKLSQLSRDLGKPQKDDVYGEGIVILN
ncbi:S8 family peptidase [Paenibacillus phytohabitans]|uniref:S8 family peptidase n=1 Tax=Paenibacillus phytohabitans TaxID=2654978 RepID=UPI0014931369